MLGPLLTDILLANGRGALTTPKAPLDNKLPDTSVGPSGTEGGIEGPGDPDQQTQDPTSWGAHLDETVEDSADNFEEPDEGKLQGQGGGGEEWEDPGQEDGQQGGVGTEHEDVPGPGEGPLVDIDDLTELMNDALHTDIKITLDYIKELQSATLDSQEPMLGSAALGRLKRPLTTTVELSKDQRYSLELFLATNSASKEVYDKSQTCLNPQTKKPYQQFNTIPLGPQLQALKRHLLSAITMKYRQCQTETLQCLLREQGGDMKFFDDILSGTEYHEAIKDGHIQPDDIIIMFSFDGAQLFENKPSDCWIGIWLILDISPKGRYKLLSVLLAFTIPGPKKPRVMDSFMFPTFYHLASLQKDGFRLWDVSEAKIVTCCPFFALGTADGPTLTHLNGLVGHMGMNGCRLCCGLLGRCQPRHTHYYPALLKPVDPVEGCDHNDVDWAAICLTPLPSPEDYLKDLTRLVGAKTDKDYKDICRETSIVKPTTPFLPGSFNRPPRDPATKMNSGYKAWEFLLYLFVLGPGVLYNFLPPIYYTHFCGLIYAVRIINQHHITKEQLEKAIVALAEFVVQFKVLHQ
ncbi:hypothetical protein DXG01_008153 [Tephrocybe rancida]|nr:hypothetical protein DXG01_008153 [Tephrocybe rancida]